VLELADHWTLYQQSPRQLRLGTLTLTERRDIAIASLAQPQAMVAAPAPWHITLPGPGLSAQATTPDIAAVWVGPGLWFMLSPAFDGAELEQALHTQASGCPITDQTDAWTVIDVTSHAGTEPLVRWLEKLVNINPATLTIGTATRALAKHQSIILWRLASDQLVLLVMRSYADSFWDEFTIR
jgi:sarcosine oxidase subunit gamma